jgi:hypothetical protein
MSDLQQPEENDGYPTEEELEKIRQWPHERQWVGLMEFVESIWWNPEWGWTKEGTTYRISTGGWSGNEDLIGALKANTMFWLCCWQSSRRGGHYEFVVRGVKPPQ